MQFTKEMLKGYIDVILLSLLFEQDLYGYELAKKVKEQSDSAFEMKEGTLYLALKRLEQNGLLESYWGDEGTGGRRKYYRILDSGKISIIERKKNLNK